MRKREKNYENVKKRHLLRKFYFQNPCIESYILMHFPNLEMSFFDMKFFEIWQRMTRFSNGLNFKTIFQYSNDLILVSNRKEVTKKYIFHVFGATHINTFLSCFGMFYNQDLEPSRTIQCLFERIFDLVGLLRSYFTENSSITIYSSFSQSVGYRPLILYFRRTMHRGLVTTPSQYFVMILLTNLY